MPDTDRLATVLRRSFLGGLGAAAGGAALIGKQGLAAAAEEPAVVGPGPISIMLNVNGMARPVRVEPCATLAEALRGPLDLTGTKIGCDRGSCSACTVLLDGAPVASCMLLAVDVGSRTVTTIEGLAQGDALHPVQEAFIEHDAMQCGYCTPGMVLSSAALLSRTPQPTEEQVRAAISGHICRCGSYPHVVEAVLAASEAGKA